MKLSIQQLSFMYGDKKIIEQLSFHVKEGEFVSLLGSSGCGKSTILNILAGILKPEAGSVRVENEPINGISTHFAYMPQNDLLFPWKTILENVCLYGKMHHKEKEAKAQAQKIFPLFGLEGYESLYPRSLSGGMRQRAAFLRTALCGADIMLLDEPFGALDVITRGDMQDWLVNMRKNLNKTTLLVTHDIDEAIYLSDRVLILGGNPSRVTKEITIKREERSRDWLYSQGKLRSEIYHSIKGINQ